MLVAVNQLQKYMDVRFSNTQQDAAEYVLEGLQSELESYLRRPVEIDTFTESHVMESNYVGVPTTSFFYNYSQDTTQQSLGYMQPPVTVYLRNSPVISVDEVVITNYLGTNTQPQVEGQDYIVRRFGVDCYRAIANDTITVTYTAGLDGDKIKHFRSLILRAATREMQNMHDDVVGVKDLNTRNVAPLQTGFTEEELRSIKRWRRHRIVG
jgi:hypothetical protein